MAVHKILANLYYIVKHIYQWKKSIFLSIGLNSVFYAISPFIWIYVPKLLIDELLGRQRPARILTILCCAFALAALTGFLTEYLQGNYRMKMNEIRYNFIRMLSDKTMSMDYPYTEDPGTLNDINTALKTIQSPLKGIGLVILKLFSLPGSLIGFFAFSAIIFNLNPFILGVLVVTIILSFFAMLQAEKFERSQRKAQSEEERKNYYCSSVLSDFQYGKDIRVYGLKSLLLPKKQAAGDKLLWIINEVQNRILQSTVIEAFLMFIREIVIYGYLIYRVLFTSMAIGDFVMYSLAMNSFVTWMDTVLKDLSAIGIQSLYVSDFREFLRKEEPEEVFNPIGIPDHEQYELEFEKVSFKYPGSEKYIFKDFSLCMKGGQKLALVGINGAGKTTLVKLLTGLYRPVSGRILLNGIDIKEFDREAYNKLFSVVFQDIHIFGFNIQENITFSDEDAEENVLMDIINKAGLKEKIGTLDQGLKTNMLKILDENGVEFSGGENQKLALARALYKSGKIIVMDEPTAALDALAEYNLYQSFDELVKQRTAIYISHRLSSTRFCDVIAFIENGELKEYGTHEELMELGKSYAKMFEVQAVYYKEEEQYVS
ncbi:ABC transporter ATP-binding protein [Anaerocolumna sp. AGMB13025]|uniref:ABC transporter ATP-binding protein n=1 Tax=Anaerocolumna sp. AGMB13025 TaxID=3039116 RepID=UPI00241D9B3B|nr:ABC transporter ATP-binding protein [Anaerocolumna sp. AGMB13025]WFR55462.1 ABC transporter ATP-binding protein [Anaerocolumna sp. AGMB13025]